MPITAKEKERKRKNSSQVKDEVAPIPLSADNQKTTTWPSLNRLWSFSKGSALSPESNSQENLARKEQELSENVRPPTSNSSKSSICAPDTPIPQPANNEKKMDSTIKVFPEESSYTYKTVIESPPSELLIFVVSLKNNVHKVSISGKYLVEDSLVTGGFTRNLWLSSKEEADSLIHVKDTQQLINALNAIQNSSEMGGMIERSIQGNMPLIWDPPLNEKLVNENKKSSSDKEASKIGQTTYSKVPPVETNF